MFSSIKVKLSLAVAFLFCLTLSFMPLIISHSEAHIQKAYEKLAIQESRFLFERILSEKKNLVTTSFRPLLTKETLEPLTKSPPNFGDWTRQLLGFGPVMGSVAGVERIFTFDSQGNLLHDHPTDPISREIPTKSPLFQSILKKVVESESTESGIVFGETDVPYLVFFIPSSDDYGRVFVIHGFALHFGSLMELYSQGVGSPSQLISGSNVISGTGKVGSNGSPFAQDSQSLQQRIEKRVVPLKNWPETHQAQLEIHLDVTSRHQAIKESKQIVIIGIILLLLVGLPGVLILTHLLLRPLSVVTASMREIENGNYEKRIDIVSKSEFGLLAHCFNEMASKIENHEVQMVEKAAALARANRVKDEFLANTSHELRTPLHGIIGLSETLLDSKTLEAKCQSTLQLIHMSAKRLSHLVNDILDFSKLRHKDLPLHFQAVSLNELFKLVQLLTEPLYRKKNLTFEISCPDSLPKVRADENRLQQILYNLIGNAIKFTESGGILLQVLPKNSQVEIKIIDTGIGIRPEDIPNIFKSFEQIEGGSNRKYGGTGLGLSITKSLIEMHGGSIGVQSEYGVGSTFTVTLPVASPELCLQSGSELLPSASVSKVVTPVYQQTEELVSHYQNTPSNPTKQTPEEKVVVLVVDDEPVNIEVITNQLAFSEYSVARAQNGQEALACLEVDPPPDLVLLDLMMPGMTGFEVCQKIRQRFSAAQLPIIILTARNQLTDLMEGFNHGANDYMVKPFSRGELLARVDNHLKLRHLTLQTIADEKFKMQVDQEMKAAKTIQDALLTPDVSDAQFEFNSFYQCASETGGDWFHLHKREDTNRLYFLIGDVTGHGLPAALVTAVVSGAVQGYFELKKHLPVGTISHEITELQNFLAEIFEHSRSEEKRAMTMAFVGIDLSTGEAIYSNSGHLPLFLCDQGTVKSLLLPGTPLGMGSGYKVPKQLPFTLKKDTLLIGFSDGILENSYQGKHAFNTRTLKQLIVQHQSCSRDLRDRVKEICLEVWQNQIMEDDASFCVLQMFDTKVV